MAKGKKRGRKRRHTRLPLAAAITATIAQKVDASGALNHDAAEFTLSLLLPSEHRNLLVQIIWSRLKQAMARGARSAIEAATVDFSKAFPGVVASYALDPDGERLTKTNRKPDPV
jgi:hypothetical protein